MANLPSSILVTGGAGFIGSALVRMLNETTDARVVTRLELGEVGDDLQLGGARLEQALARCGPSSYVRCCDKRGNRAPFQRSRKLF